MTKGKRAPEKRDWARIVNREWRLNLVSGEVMTPARELSVAEARKLVVTLPVYYLGYLISVRQITGDKAAIAAELGRSRTDVGGAEFNEFYLFRGDRGSEAVVIDHQH